MAVFDNHLKGRGRSQLTMQVLSSSSYSITPRQNPTIFWPIFQHEENWQTAKLGASRTGWTYLFKLSTEAGSRTGVC